MKLHEMDPDMILAELERRGEAYVLAKGTAKTLEGMYDRMKAATYSAYRSQAGTSVDDAKARTAADGVLERNWMEWQEKERELDRAYLALERARIAVELWRSTRADMRRV